jgi:hypothetical protein
MAYSQKDKVSLISEIEKALSDIVYGSVELYVQDRKVTQITVRNIRKTSMEVQGLENEQAQNLQNIVLNQSRQNAKEGVKTH